MPRGRRNSSARRPHAPPDPPHPPAARRSASPPPRGWQRETWLPQREDRSLRRPRPGRRGRDGFPTLRAGAPGRAAEVVAAGGAAPDASRGAKSDEKPPRRLDREHEQEEPVRDSHVPTAQVAHRTISPEQEPEPIQIHAHVGWVARGAAECGVTRWPVRVMKLVVTAWPVRPAILEEPNRSPRRDDAKAVEFAGVATVPNEIMDRVSPHPQPCHRDRQHQRQEADRVGQPATHGNPAITTLASPVRTTPWSAPPRRGVALVDRWLGPPHSGHVRAWVTTRLYPQYRQRYGSCVGERSRVHAHLPQAQGSATNPVSINSHTAPRYGQNGRSRASTVRTSHSPL